MALLNDDALETGKCIQDCERAKRATRFFKYISALKTYDSPPGKSQISIYTLLINHCLSVQYVHDCVRNTRDMFIRNKKLEKNYIERAERASQNVCTFASEKCFTYRPETREKAIINDCEQANFFVCLKHAILLIRVGSRGPP